MDHPLYRPLLASSITVSSSLVGCQLSVSHVSASTVITTPNISEATAFHQLSAILRRGQDLYRPTAMLFPGLGCYASAALSYYHYYCYGGGRRPALQTGIVPRLLLVGTLMLAAVPFTILWIIPAEDRLRLMHRMHYYDLKARRRQARWDRECGREPESEESMRKASECTLREARRWERLNLVRALLPAVGVVSAWCLCWSVDRAGLESLLGWWFVMTFVLMVMAIRLSCLHE
ncbi:uncharacterized protein PG986_014647 [Apiospora aurea]|uniref:Uncharacterized protein n=1 Tax=Apiospora aurea TaxID=335848 RepID=A0ABR1PUJ5_9PEZI